MRRKQLNLLGVVDRTIGEVRKKLKDDALKPTVGNLIKLLQLRRDLGGAATVEKITAGWVEEWDATRTGR